MQCISAYEYVVGEAKMTDIFCVSPKSSGFPGHSSSTVSNVAINSLGDICMSLSYSSPCGVFVAFSVWVDWR